MTEWIMSDLQKRIIEVLPDEAGMTVEEVSDKLGEDWELVRRSLGILYTKGLTNRDNRKRINYWFK